MKRILALSSLFNLVLLLANPTPSPGLPEEEGKDPGLRTFVERFTADLESLERFYNVSASAVRQTRMKEFYSQWETQLSHLNYDSLTHAGKIDYILFRNYVQHELRSLELEKSSLADQSKYVPFAPTITELEEARRRFEWADPAKSAEILASLEAAIAATQKKLDDAQKSQSPGGESRLQRTIANRAAQTTQSLQRVLKRWFEFYNGYDPTFTWWANEPYKNVDQALDAYAKFLRERVAGVKASDDTTIIGYPIGREAIMSELSYEMIPYSPEDLIIIANKEYAWCENEMKKASRDMGFGDDWHKALEEVKKKYVSPGAQPELIRKLATEAIDYVTQKDLVTVPDLAKETWRMEMLTPEQQRVSPFFLGGETILVSYPTSTMTHAEKLMTLRGNNPHFSRAVVHHELIPGHHLQGFMNSRYRTYRHLFSTPFWTEGWAFYWEMLLWDHGFAKSPEDRVGMLFWRMHRCARIIFSLSFHLGKMSPRECIDFLVEKVGHERANAAAEVRRSFAGNYGPLYQCAYMLGALQFRQLHRDVVGAGTMSDRAFHDAILHEHNIPVEMVRAALSAQPPGKHFTSGWKFYGSPSGK